MNPELVVEFDTAAQALDALASASIEPRSSIEDRLTHDIADTRVHGLDPDSWHARWIHTPLRAIRAIEGLRLKLMVELDEVRAELREAEAELSLLREAGRSAESDLAARKAVRLLCHEADVRHRLDAPVAHRITAARNGIARILEVSLRHAGRELLRVARDSAQPGTDPASAREAFEQAEAYNRLVAEAHRVTGGVDVPVFLPDHVARLRSAAGLEAARAAGEATGQAMPTVKVPVVTPDLLAARSAAKAGRPAATVKVGPVARPAAPASAVPAQPSSSKPSVAGLSPAPSGPVAAAPAPPPTRSPDAPKTKPSLPRLRGAIVGA